PAPPPARPPEPSDLLPPEDFPPLALPPEDFPPLAFSSPPIPSSSVASFSQPTLKSSRSHQHRGQRWIHSPDEPPFRVIQALARTVPIPEIRRLIKRIAGTATFVSQSHVLVSILPTR